MSNNTIVTTNSEVLNKLVLILRGGPPAVDPKTGQQGVGSGNYQHKKIAHPVQEYHELGAQAQADITAHMHEHGIFPDDMDHNLDAIWERAKANPNFEKMKHWYNDVHDYVGGLGDKYGLELHQAVGITAALSPQRRWEYNAVDAEHVMRVLSENKPVTITEAQAALIYAADLKGRNTKNHPMNLREYNGKDANFKGKDLVGTHLPSELPSDVLFHVVNGLPRACGRHNVGKAVEIFRGGNPNDVLGGPKVRSFYNNMLDPDDDKSVTIDSHASRGAAGWHNDPKVIQHTLEMPGSGELADGVGSYPLYARKFKEAAKRAGVRPHEFQAATWVQWKEDHPAAEKRARTRKQNAEKKAAKLKPATAQPVQI